MQTMSTRNGFDYNQNNHVYTMKRLLAMCVARRGRNIDKDRFIRELINTFTLLIKSLTT